MDDETEKNQDAAEDIEFIPDEEGIPQEFAGKIKKVKEEMKKCEAERKEYLEGWQRAKADFINFKKDEGKRFEDMARFVTTSIVDEFLPVLDSFDLALSNFSSQNLEGQALSHGIPESVEKGIMMIRSQFEDVLRKRGIEEIRVAPGDPFDPSKHESVGETKSEYPPGTIADVVQRGYMFRERVMRPARVRLVKVDGSLEKENTS